ncbi:MAG: putative DNA-binding domain-containing protein [Deltaproteobacteria bacterium]|nr:putative DNA-binding domain-containing protein [Deltaproteobacteria bacterium]
MAEPAWHLDRTERLLWRLITAPEGVAKGLVAEGDPEAIALGAVLVSDERLSAVERLDVYANMYFARLLDVVREDFPTVARLLGSASFHNLVTDYLLAHPPTHFSLRYAGAALPGFIAAHALAGERPWLGDLARLEWTLTDLFDGADSETIDATALAGFAPDEWPTLRFRTVPAFRLLELEWAVHETSAAARDEREPEADPPLPERRPTLVRVWRLGHQVVHREIDPIEGRALAALAAGRSFAELCEEVGALVGADEAPARVATLLAGWLADGMIADVELDPAT